MSSQPPSAEEQQKYQARLRAEEAFYRDCEQVHELPEIFHYWSNQYIKPKLEAEGFESLLEFFTAPLRQQCDRAPDRAVRFVSIGAGNCDIEIQIAGRLLSQGRRNFVIDCLDLNETMLERGRTLAAEQGVGEHIQPLAGDFNHWQPAEIYDAVLAVQALHHVLKLEDLFDAVRGCLAPGGRFVIGDMIGRNGHLRWPEGLRLIHEYWRRLPPSYRYNHQLRRYEEWYQDWDCSGEGFEGIRAQDILPLLVERFQFHTLIAYGSLIDPFIERSFGHNFDAADAWDRAFIDEVHARDEQEIAAGRLTPTHLLAIIGNEAPDSGADLNPARFIRRPDGPQETACGPSGDPYEWSAWPHDPRTQLQAACRYASEATALAASLQSDRLAVHAHLTRLTQEFEERTRWALKLDKELEERTSWALSLRDEVEASARQVQSLTAQLAAAQTHAAETGRLGFLPLRWRRALRAVRRRLLP